jgi:hypothetical protein
MVLAIRRPMTRFFAPALFVLVCAPLATGCPEDTETKDPTPEGLEPPPSGQGFQFETPENEVPAGEEIQHCYFFKVGDLLKANGLDETKPLNLNRVQIDQTEGSHHMNVFRVRTIVGMDPTKGPYLDKNGQGECFKAPNWADWPLVANTQIDGRLDWSFPEGVANVIDPSEYIMLQSHYVNATTQKTPEGTGKVKINFWHLPEAEKVHEMGTVFATKQSIRVCAGNPEPQFSGTCQFNSKEEVTIIGANAHFHSRGKEFNMFKWDGVSTEEPPVSDRFYTSTTWDEPPMEHSPKLDTVVKPGGGVFYTCDFQWQKPTESVGCDGLNAFDKMKYMTPDENLDCCYTFGPLVDRNEHCNIFVYYYPKSDDIACF